MNKISVTIGLRYRRRNGDKDHVWVRSYDGISVSLITNSGPVSMPVAAFVEKFEADPIRKRRSER